MTASSTTATSDHPATTTSPEGFQPVFIVGGSRTGSELLMQLIREYTPIDQVQEMHLLSKPWLRKDYAHHVAALGSTDRPGYAEALADLMYSQRLFGAFWKRNMPSIDRDRLVRALQNTDFSLPDVLRVLLELHAETLNKTVPGAKFPVHLAFAHRLIEWFPECKIINTIRDPRATYSSQARKHRKQNKSAVSNVWVNLQHMAHTSMQFRDGVSCHEQLKGRSGYLLWRYEDLMLDPKGRLHELCNFLKVPFNDGMLAPRLKDNSSYGEKGARTARFKTDAVGAWKQQVSPVTASLIRFINRGPISRMGY